MIMVCMVRTPVSPPVRFLCCGGHRKDGGKCGKDAGDKEKICPDDIDYGNHIVGPNGPEDLPPVMAFPHANDSY